MALQWSIDSEARLVRLTYSGTVTFEEWAAVMQSVFDHRAYEPGFAFLVDRRLAFAPTTYFVERAVGFARQNNQHLAGSRWALVINNSAAFGMMRLGQMLAKGLPTTSCIFKKLDEAERWLSDSQPGAGHAGAFKE